MKLERKLAVWKPLKIGQRVRSKTWRKGQCGYIFERLDDLISGLARYGVRLDNDPQNTADFCRYELVCLKHYNH